ncbi:glutathione peroxidase [soil metagenome]
MKKIIFPAVFILTIVSMSFQSDSPLKKLYDFKARTLDGEDFDFSSLKGKKVLIVNTASECGFTPQYKDLEELYEKYSKDSNFTILGFPCNQFGGQEPGSSTEIKTFCTKNYGVTFQMMEKIDVKGDKQDPIYKWLTSKSENGVEDSDVKWNFGKYMINADGTYYGHASSRDLPNCDAIVKWIEGK